MIAAILLLANSEALYAQAAGPGTISGALTDSSSHAPLENANVLLLRAADSSRVTGTVTGKDGRFTLAGIPFGTYFVEGGLIGYRSYRSPLITLDEAHSAITLPAIALKGAALLLEPIETSASRKLLEEGLDRRVYNVAHDVLAPSSTASDLLQRIPSVQVDLDGNVSLRGSSDVKILINGKQSPLMGAARADVLQQLPATGIERIEVITNPSARFTPEGTSGIINIVTRRGAGAALSGDATVHVGAQERHNENLSVSGHRGRLDWFTNYGYRDDRRQRIGDDDRLFGGSTGTYDEDSRVAMHPIVHLATSGFTFHATPRDEFELSGDYLRRRPSRAAVSTIITRDAGGSMQTAFDRLQTGYELNREAGITSAYQHEFAKKDRQLRTEASYSDAPQSEAAHFVEHWSTPLRSDPASDVLLRQNEKQGHLTMDYVDPLGEDSKLEAGYALELHRQDIHSDADSIDVGSQIYVPNPAKTYRFKLDQTIHALYATYGRGFGHFSVQGGLRGEYAIVSSDLITGGNAFTDRYAGLYATLHLNYETSPKGVVQLSYSRRIRRPESDDLNPFPEFTDPYNMESGNPRLRPESIHSFDLGYQIRAEHFSFVPSLYYRYRTDAFTRVTVAVNDSVFLRTMANLATDRSIGFEPVLTLSMGRLLQGNVSANVFHERIDASNLGYTGKRSVTSWSGAANLNLTPWPATMFQLNATYRSARLTPQGDARPSFGLNLGARENLAHDRFALTLAVTDVFKTQRQETQLDVAGTLQHVLTRRDAQIVYAGVTYHYGRVEKKRKDKGLQYEDQ